MGPSVGMGWVSQASTQNLKILSLVMMSDTYINPLLKQQPKEKV